MTETINLKVDRSLLYPKFETYYLDNGEVSLQSIDLPNSVSEFTLADKQLYSYLHFSAFSRDFNYLFTDPFGGQSPVCYYVDNQFSILRINVDQSEHPIFLPVCVFNLPFNQFKPDECLVSLSFPSNHFALVLISRCSTVKQNDCDSFLLVLSTGDRQTPSNSWTTVKSINLGTCWNNQDPSKLVDSHFQSKDDEDKLIVNILTVAKNIDEKFECVLSCLHLSKAKQLMGTNESPEWTISRLQQLTGASYPSYIGVDINKDGELFLTIASSNQFRSTFDSSEKLPGDSGNQLDTIKEKENIYLYHQDDLQITVDFKLPQDTDKNQIQVNFGLKEMEIYVRGERVFKETLWEQIERESCTWTLERNPSDRNSILEITLAKKNENQLWNQLIKGKEQGSQLMSPEESISFKELNSLITNLSDRNESNSGYISSITDNEPCDEVTEDLILYRFNCHQNSITHQAYLAGHQWLFYRKVNNNPLPCFSLRHDIDAVIWQPKAQGSRFHVEHISTFPALGYVQASKEMKVFFNCSPDFDYSFIVDSTNHIFIYKEPTRCEGVVNRKAGVHPKIAKQKVINLGNELIQVLGSVAFKGFLLILGPKKLISIKVDF